MKRNTVQREFTLEAVKELHCHSTAEDVYAVVAKKHPNVSRATVYRNLNELSEEGEIQKVHIPDGADRFDHQCHKHYHFRCEECGKVYDVDMDYIENLTKSVKDKHGFEFLGYDLMFKGICAECRKNKGEKI